jgi:putative flippase GtrA
VKGRFIELIRYGIYGGITTAFNLLFFFILEKLGMYYILANILAHIIAVVVNYVLNKKFVFCTDSISKSDWRNEFLKFLGVRVISLIVDNVLFYMLIDGLKVPLYIGRIGLSMTIIMITFIVNKIYVFKRN